MIGVKPSDGALTPAVGVTLGVRVGDGVALGPGVLVGAGVPVDPICWGTPVAVAVGEPVVGVALAAGRLVAAGVLVALRPVGIGTTDADDGAPTGTGVAVSAAAVGSTVLALPVDDDVVGEASAAPIVVNPPVATGAPMFWGIGVPVGEGALVVVPWTDGRAVDGAVAAAFAPDGP
ncbi:MAG: hypothetical protein QOF51_1738 [Chloroflexota bacterium]|nr:hypothetical protein [Chloroflexota bacterium]